MTILSDNLTFFELFLPSLNVLKRNSKINPWKYTPHINVKAKNENTISERMYPHNVFDCKCLFEFVSHLSRNIICMTFGGAVITGGDQLNLDPT